MSVTETTIESNMNQYFFKTKEDFEAHKDEIVNNSNIFIESDGEYGNVKIDTLWTNPNPTSAFAAQTITVEDMSGYDYLLIKLQGANGNTYYTENFVKIDNTTHRLLACFADNLNYRDISAQGTTITFGDGLTVLGYNTSSPTTDNKYGIPYQIIGIKLIQSQAELTNKYSTDETIVGEWIDGKPIYRKVYTDISVKTSSSAAVLATIDLSSFNIENMINIYGYYNWGSSNNIMPIPTTTSVYQLYNYYENNAYYFAGINSNFGSSKLNVILEYTKTTD